MGVVIVAFQVAAGRKSVNGVKNMLRHKPMGRKDGGRSRHAVIFK